MTNKKGNKGALRKIIIEGEEYHLPAQVINRGQFSVSVATPERKAILMKLLKKAKTANVGTAAWKAILAYVGEEVKSQERGPRES